MKDVLQNRIAKCSLQASNGLQMRPYGSYENVNPNPPNNQIPPITATANNFMASPLQQTSSSSFSSPSQTPMPQSQNSWLWEIEKQ